jgi:branched-chain amino acid transport system substrate-binding protein
MGYGDTDFVLAAAPVFQRSGIPFVTSGATDPNIPNIVGPGVFLTAFGDDDQAYAMADFARRALKVKSVILWTNGSTDFTRILAKFFKERFQKLGGHIVLEQYFDNQATDFSSYVDRVKSMRPSADAIFISAVPSDISRTVTPLRRAGLAIPILSGDGFDADIVHVLGTANLATNIYFTTHTYRGDSRPEVLEFMKEYRKQYGQDPENAFAALGFDAANLIASAIQRAKSAEPAAVTRSLAQTRGFKGVTGEISFSRSTHVPVKPVAVVKVEAGHYSVVESWTPKDHASGTLEAPGSRGSLATGQGTPFHKTPNILPGRAVPLEHLGAHSLHDLACLFHRSLRPMRSPISMLPFVEKKNKG